MKIPKKIEAPALSEMLLLIFMLQIFNMAVSFGGNGRRDSEEGSANVVKHIHNAEIVR